MSLDDVAGDAQPEAGAAVVGRAGLVDASEALEDPVPVGERDASAVILDDDRHGVVVAMHA